MSEQPGILNYRHLSGRLSSSGQPTEEQISDLAKSGARCVINLGPHRNTGALDDEPGTVATLGLRYIYIPEDFDAPSEADFATFCDALTDTAPDRTHVHCIYNARVSAFFTRWVREGKGQLDVDADQMMDNIWRPGGVWATFLGDATRQEVPSAYKGYAY